MRDFWRTLGMQQAWLIDAPLSSFHEKATVALSFGRIRTRLGVNNSQVFRLTFDFFPHEFAACSKPLSRDNHRKASYPRTQQRDQGAGWTHVHATRVVVKTTSLPSWPRYRHSNKALPRCFYFLAYKFKQWQWMSIWANILWTDSLNIVTKNLHN